MAEKSSGLQHTPTVGKQIIIGSLLLIPIAFYSGWISVASGVFTTMLYLYLLRFDQLHATAMTLAINGLVWNALGAIAHLTLGHIYWEIAPGLIIGAVTGSYLGASLGIKQGNRFPETHLPIICRYFWRRIDLQGTVSAKTATAKATAVARTIARNKYTVALARHTVAVETTQVRKD